MHKLFLTLNGSYPNRWFRYSTMRNPRLLSLVSYFHSSTRILESDSKLGSFLDEEDEIKSSKYFSRKPQVIEDQFEQIEATNGKEMTVRISHPWPEWVDLMEFLLKQGYFEGGRNSFRNTDLGTKEMNCIRTACLNFARDRHDLIRHFSRKDIRIISGYGCPSVDRKVVNSGKRLRAHVGIDEESVCGSCNLRGDCERAYVKARSDEVARAVDVMRVLVMYGLDNISSMVQNKACLDKIITESVRRLLKELVYSFDLSKLTKPSRLSSMEDQSLQQNEVHEDVTMKEGDWLCPSCNFLNFSKNLKCLRCECVFLKRLRELNKDLDHLPLKKGDWICQKCNFLNFAKNSLCLQCNEKPRNRQLNPGEWECGSCNYVNFRKNMVCLRCDHRRPKGSKSSNSNSSTTRIEKSAVYTLFEPNFARIGGDSVGRISNDQAREVGTKSANTWRFIENDVEGPSISPSGKHGLVDFPILGGKSDLSHSVESREKWKEEILKKSNDREDAKKKDEIRCSSSNIQGGLGCSELTDDEEMAGWFGNLKIETQSLKKIDFIWYKKLAI